MNFKSELSHHDIFAIFNHDRQINTISVYTSFIGEFSSYARLGSFQQHYILKPQKINLSRRKPSSEELVDVFGDADEVFNQIDKKNFSYTRNKIITHIEWFVNFKYINGDKIPDDVLQYLKLFKNIEDAELHFIDMTHNYIKEKRLIDTIDQYNKLIKKHSELQPEKILTIMGN